MSIRSLVLAWLAASAIAPFLHLDAWPAGMLLTYPPRLVYIAPTVMLAGLFALRRERAPAVIAALAAVLLIASLGWGGATLGSARTASDRDASQVCGNLSMVSFNVHNQAAALDRLGELVDREGIDIVHVQEVRLNNRARLAEALPDFALFRPQRSPEFNPRSTGVLVSVIGIRRDRLDAAWPVETATAITGYRTFAILASVDGRPMWLVNVHATKPFWLEDGLLALLADAVAKARWHRDAGDRLLEWLADRSDIPVVVAGDFNAPHYSPNLQLGAFHNAHLDVGRGPHLTFPVSFPVWGIDHTLANDHIRFCEYRLLKAGPSDHRAQLVRFRVGGRDR